jgi:hypothetical protein
MAWGRIRTGLALLLGAVVFFYAAVAGFLFVLLHRRGPRDPFLPNALLTFCCGILLLFGLEWLLRRRIAPDCPSVLYVLMVPLPAVLYLIYLTAIGIAPAAAFAVGAAAASGFAAWKMRQFQVD